MDYYKELEKINVPYIEFGEAAMPEDSTITSLKSLGGYDEIRGDFPYVYKPDTLKVKDINDVILSTVSAVDGIVQVKDELRFIECKEISKSILDAINLINNTEPNIKSVDSYMEKSSKKFRGSVRFFCDQEEELTIHPYMFFDFEVASKISKEALPMSRWVLSAYLTKLRRCNKELVQSLGLAISRKSIDSLLGKEVYEFKVDDWDDLDNINLNNEDELCFIKAKPVSIKATEIKIAKVVFSERELENKKQRAMYEMRQKAMHDEANALYSAREQGIEQGKEKGKVKAKLEVAKNLLDVLDDETISMKTGLSIIEVRELRKSEIK